MKFRMKKIARFFLEKTKDSYTREWATYKNCSWPGTLYRKPKSPALLSLVDLEHFPSTTRTILQSPPSMSSFKEIADGAHGGNSDAWKDMAKDYKNISGHGKDHPTLAPTLAMLKSMDAAWPFAKSTGILDNGCGPGIVMGITIKQHGKEIPDSCRLMCADFSAGMVEQVLETKAQEVAGGNNIWSRVEAERYDAQDMSAIPDESFSHITAGMVYFMVPEPQKALSESRRLLTSANGGGVLALSSWKTSEWLEMMHDALEVKPGATNWPAFPAGWTSAEGVKGEMEAAGFKDVEAKEVTTYMWYDDAATTCRWMAEKMPQAVAMMKDWTREEKKKYIDHVTKALVRLHGEKNGRMVGTTIVGVGRK